jgi:fumarate reductase flavoprotein subunit
MIKKESDIVIIAAGISGLAAAIAAAENGAKVIVLEKTGKTGGQANFGGGLFGVETRVHRLKQYPLTREEAFSIYMEFNRWNVDARLIKIIIDRSADTLDWLESMGIEFYDTASHGTGNYYTWHIIRADESKLPKNTLTGNAIVLMKAMTERANSLGVEFLMNTTAKKVLKDGDNVTGVLAAHKEKEVHINSKAVIMATGAYGGVFQGFLKGTKGDGIRMAKEVGAAVVDMDYHPVKGQGHMGPGMIMVKEFYSLAFTLSQPCLMVNLLGERFMNEEAMNSSCFGSNAVARQKRRIAFNIFDEDTKNIFKETGFDFGHGFPRIPITKGTNFDEELEQVVKDGVDGIYVADSIDELAAKLGIDVATLADTINEYNHACDTGCDILFNKKARYLRPVRKHRFYASRQGAGNAQWPGIKVNYKTEVITEDHQIIPGFYAAGIDISPVLYYDVYPNILPGNAMGFAANTGRIAGENASQFAKNQA